MQLFGLNWASSIS